MTKFSKRNAAKVAVVLTVLGGAAQAQQACSTHKIVDGDTLTTIALQAYKTSDFSAIYDANRNIIKDPSKLPVGQVLQLPCTDDNQPSETESPQSAAFDATGQSARQTIRMVADANLAPYSHRQMPGGGLLPRMAVAALEAAETSQPHDIAYTPGGPELSDALLYSKSYDVLLTGAMPDCSDVSYEWSNQTTMRCEGFLASDPVFDAVHGFYGLPGNSYTQAEHMSDLKGARICRTTGWFAQHYEKHGLSDDRTLIQRGTARDCINAVRSGRVDVMAHEAGLMHDILGTETLAEAGIVENPYLFMETGLRFTALKSNPDALEIIARLNLGLAILRDGDEWDSIVSQAVADKIAIFLAHK